MPNADRLSHRQPTRLSNRKNLYLGNPAGERLSIRGGGGEVKGKVAPGGAGDWGGKRSKNAVSEWGTASKVEELKEKCEGGL